MTATDWPTNSAGRISAAAISSSAAMMVLRDDSTLPTLPDSAPTTTANA